MNDIVIVFKDWTVKNVNDIEDYGLFDGSGCFYFKRRGGVCMLPIYNILFFGTKEDYESFMH